MTNSARPQLARVAEHDRRAIPITIDGEARQALEGDTVLTAVLTWVPRLRVSEFGDGPRAGFCLMGACQDCWMWTADGRRLRACSTYVEPGMSVLTNPSEVQWPLLGS